MWISQYLDKKVKKCVASNQLVPQVCDAIWQEKSILYLDEVHTVIESSANLGMAVPN